MVRLRLTRRGKRKKPFYWIVAADARVKRDGKILDKLGFYNPIAKEQEIGIKLNEEKIINWYMNGARATDTVYSLMKKHGIVKKINEKRMSLKKALS